MIFSQAGGECKIIINGQEKKTLKTGAAFGELALLYSAARSASVKCVEETFLWGIDRLLFKRIMQKYKQKEYEVNREFIDKIPFFGMFFIRSVE